MPDSQKVPRGKPMRMGTKFILNRHDLPEMEHAEPDQFVIVRIVQAKAVPGCFSNDLYWGYRAVDSAGHNFYRNWENYPDDSMTPGWLWFCQSHDQLLSGCWYDVTVSARRCPKHPSWLTGEFTKILHWCTKHRELYRAGEKCFHCQYPPVGETPSSGPLKKAWNGWID